MDRSTHSKYCVVGDFHKSFRPKFHFRSRETGFCTAYVGITPNRQGSHSISISIGRPRAAFLRFLHWIDRTEKTSIKKGETKNQFGKAQWVSSVWVSHRFHYRTEKSTSREKKKSRSIRKITHDRTSSCWKCHLKLWLKNSCNMVTTSQETVKMGLTRLSLKLKSKLWISNLICYSYKIVS